MGTLITIGNSIYSQPSGVGGAPADTTSFIFTVETTGSDETFTIPCQDVGVFDATIDWGDGGATSAITTYNDADLAHVYATADTYTITISGTFPNIYFNNAGDKLKVRTVEQLGSVGWAKLNGAFYGCSGITDFTAAPCDTSDVTDMAHMMRDWPTITNTPSLSGLDTANVTSMSGMMYGWSSMTTPPDLSSFNTANVTSMSSMMQGWPSMTSPPDLSGFDTANVTSMAGMMYNWSSMTSPPDLSSFNTVKVANMSSMMWGWSSMGSIGNIGQVDFNIAAMTAATNMCLNTTMTTAAYDALLIAWEAQTEKTGVAFHAGGSKYTAGGAAATARGVLTATSGWTVTDAGTV